MNLLQRIFRKKPRTRNVRVKNLVFDMADYRQSPAARDIDLMYRKKRDAAR